MKRLLLTVSILFTSLFAISQSLYIKKSGSNYLVRKSPKAGYIEYVKIDKSSAPDTLLYLKNFGDFVTAANTAITEKKTLVISDTVTLSGKNSFGPGLKLKALTSAVIKINFTGTGEIFGIEIGEGLNQFENITFLCGTQGNDRGGSCFLTTQGETTFINRFINCKWQGDFKYCYSSSQGHGLTEFINCNLYSWFENIQYYNQSGPKDLTLKNCTLQTDSSHCIYAHPTTNINFDSVFCLGTGKLVMDSYRTNPIPGNSTYQHYNNCGNAPGAKCNKWPGALPMWRIWAERGDFTITNSKLPSYEWTAENIYLKNVTLINGGNGCFVNGKTFATNCTGCFTATNYLSLTGCTIEYLEIRNGAKVDTVNTTIGYTLIK